VPKRHRVLVDSFKTVGGYYVSLHRAGRRRYELSLHNGQQFSSVILGAGDVGRLIQSLQVAQHLSSMVPKLTVVPEDDNRG
jgi:hypothetical protein